MEKIWLREYPAGVPAEINLQEFTSLKEMLESSCREYSERPAFSNLDHTLSYAELDQQSLALAAFLQQELGLRKGDRVALMMPNLLQYPVALYGVLRAGLVVVNVNPLYTPRELEHQLNDSGANTIIILENFAQTLQQVIARTPVQHVITTQIGDLLPFPKRTLVNLLVKYVKRMVPKWQLPATIKFRHVLERGAQLELQAPELNHQDIAFLQYTGGTTGVSKGAVLSHGNMVANLLQVENWIKNLFTEQQDIIITALPLYHIFSLTANCLVFSKVGAHNILITNPRDMPGFIKELGKYRFTIMTGVNTLFNGLLNTPGFDRLDFSSLKVSIAGGMALQRAVGERWLEKTGTPLIEGYGLTETSPVVCANLTDLKHFNGSIGLPLPSTEISIRDENGQELGIGESGE
ncbi:MAG: AMP-binding protein [Candidatus Competibacteraceae bacterium]|nr:AMP-binding protein [Candidatus Competibacteraceae bacterium]